MILSIDTAGIKPIYEQMRDQIVIGMASKQLKQNEALPSVRRLAADLGINLHTVNKAYTALCDEGYIVMDRRKGAVISANVPNSEDFITNLNSRITLVASEAICRGIKEKEFIKLCKDLYNSVLSHERED